MTNNSRRLSVLGEENIEAFKRAWANPAMSTREISKLYGLTAPTTFNLAKDFALGPKVTDQSTPKKDRGWPPERVAELRKLAAEGLSGEKIAQAMGGGLTREAIGGKCWRLGIKLKGALTKAEARRSADMARRTQRKLRGQTVRPQSKVFGETKVPSARPKLKAEPMPFRLEEAGFATPETITPRLCNWPIGDPKSPGFTFCGRSKDGDGPYCAGHASIAYQAAKPGKPHTAAALARSIRKFVA